MHWNWIGKRYAARERRATTPTSNPLHLATSTWKNHDWLIHAALAARRTKLTKPKLQACRGARALRFFELALCMIRFFHFYLGALIIIVALIVTHTDWVCRVARVLYLFYYFDSTILVVPDYILIRISRILA